MWRVIFSVFLWVQFAQATPLSKKIDQQLHHLERHTSFSVILQQADSGQVLYQHQPDRVQVPASTLKLMTAGGALLALGKDYRFTTDMQGMGAVKHGVLSGPVVLHFSRDPTLTIADLRKLLTALLAHGIHRVPQGVWLQPGVEANMPYPPGWMSEDKVECYGAPQSSVMINENCVHVQIVKQGKHWRIRPDQLSGLVRVHNDLVSSSHGVCQWTQGILGSNYYRLAGCMSHAQWVGLGVTDVPRYAQQVVRGLLAELGIQAKVHWGSPRSFVSNWHVQHRSNPLSHLLTKMLKESDNVIANALLLKVGESKKEALTWEGSVQNIRQLLQQKFSLSLTGMSWVEGSGASRYNLLSASHLIKLMQSIYSSSLSQDYWDFLPVFGVDGTLAHRLVHSVVVGQVAAKTGTLHEVSSLAGLIHTRHGHKVLMAIMMQGEDEKHFRSVQDEIVRTVYEQA